MFASMNRKNERRGAMLAHVVAQEQSGTSRKVYCQEHALKLHVLNYWCGKSKGLTAHGQGFAQVQVCSEQGLELHYPNGVRLVLPRGTTLDHITACIRLY